MLLTRTIQYAPHTMTCHIAGGGAAAIEGEQCPGAAVCVCQGQGGSSFPGSHRLPGPHLAMVPSQKPLSVILRLAIQQLPGQ